MSFQMSEWGVLSAVVNWPCVVQGGSLSSVQWITTDAYWCKAGFYQYPMNYLFNTETLILFFCSPCHSTNNKLLNQPSPYPAMFVVSFTGKNKVRRDICVIQSLTWSFEATLGDNAINTSTNHFCPSAILTAPPPASWYLQPGACSWLRHVPSVAQEG